MDQQIQQHINYLAQRLATEIYAGDVQILLHWHEELAQAINKIIDARAVSK